LLKENINNIFTNNIKGFNRTDKSLLVLKIYQYLKIYEYDY
jgi:hypothetical protein